MIMRPHERIQLYWYGLGWILMQPNDLDASKANLALLHSEGTRNFDVTMNALLCPIRFSSHSCTERERH